MSKNDLVNFFMDSDDHSDFIAMLKSLSFQFDESERFLSPAGGEQLTADPYASLNFFASRLYGDTIVIGRVALPKRRKDRISEFKALQRAFTEIRNWVTSRYTNELVEVSTLDPEKQVLVDDIWVGPRATEKLATGTVSLKEGTNSSTEYRLRPKD